MNVVPFPARPVLDSMRVAEIAARHGVGPGHLVVRLHVQAAIDMHGKECRPGDDWSCEGVDPETGLFDAARLLDVWIRQELLALALVAKSSDGPVPVYEPEATDAKLFSFPPQPVLRPWRVEEIAARHGLTANHPLVAATLAGALDMHGADRPDWDGDVERCWDVDPRTGKLDAARLLDGWLAAETAERRIAG